MKFELLTKLTKYQTNLQKKSQFLHETCISPNTNVGTFSQEGHIHINMYFHLSISTV